MISSKLIHRLTLSPYRCMVQTLFAANNRAFHGTLPTGNEEDNGLEKNPYFKKYAEKIQLVKSSGLHNPSKEKMNKQLLKESREWKKNIGKAESSLHAHKEKQSNTQGSKLPGKLEDLIRMDLLEDKTNVEIAKIWTEYFKSKDSISAVIPAPTFNIMMERSNECPMFLYPLPKDQGYEFVLSQFDGNKCFFTSLINYQVHDANAPWQLCLTYYTELRESSGIVLMASEIDPTAMTVLEAQCLAQLQQMFYINGDEEEERFSLVRKFNQEPNEFRYMDLIHEIESSNMIIKPGVKV